MKPLPIERYTNDSADFLRRAADDETGQHEMEPHEAERMKQAYEEATKAAA